MLAGGSHRYDDFLVPRSIKCIRYFKNLIKYISTVQQMDEILLNDEQQLKILADEIARSRLSVNPLYRCIGALDFIAITIINVLYDYLSRNFYSR